MWKGRQPQPEICGQRHWRGPQRGQGGRRKTEKNQSSPCRNTPAFPRGKGGTGESHVTKMRRHGKTKKAQSPSTCKAVGLGTGLTLLGTQGRVAEKKQCTLATLSGTGVYGGGSGLEIQAPSAGRLQQAGRTPCLHVPGSRSRDKRPPQDMSEGPPSGQCQHQPAWGPQHQVPRTSPHPDAGVR